MYSIVSERKDGFTQYGIQGDTVAIHDITVSLDEIRALLEQCIRCELSETHLQDIVEDWFGKNGVPATE